MTALGHDRLDQERPDQDSPDHVPDDQERPDQDSPDQLRPDQDRPDHERPDHDKPDQERPDQDKPDQDRPDHERPDHWCPFQEPPSQLSPEELAFAHVLASQVFPKMSCSPLSGTPFISRRIEPRASSNDPFPFEASWVCGVESTLAHRTASKSTAPAPVQRGVPITGRAVALSMFLTASGDRSGLRLNRAATPPETMAADCDVPEPLKKFSPARAFG